MSLKTFNHPLAAVKKAGHLNLPATQECCKLASLKAKTFDELITFGRGLYVGHPDQLQILVFSIVNDTAPGPVEHKLAEAFYYRCGHLLAKQYRFADMTHPQKEHEALALGIFTQEQIGRVSNFELEIKLRSWVNEEHEDRFAPLRTALVPDGGYQTGSLPNGSGGSGVKVQDGENEKKPIYVKVWRKELGKFVTYAY